MAIIRKVLYKGAVLICGSFKTPAVGTDTFDQIVDSPRLEAFRHSNRRDGRVFEAEGAVALFAVEMDVDIVVPVFVMAVAEFVADAVAGVVQHMHEVRFAEGLQSPENVGLVDGLHDRFELGHGHRAARRRQGAGDDDAVRRRLHAVAFHQLYQ